MSNDGKYIDGVPWAKAVSVCLGCGQLPEVWRASPEVRGTQRHAVRCARCKVEIHDKSRARTIRRWNVANSEPDNWEPGTTENWWTNLKDLATGDRAREMAEGVSDD